MRIKYSLKFTLLTLITLTIVNCTDTRERLKRIGKAPELHHTDMPLNSPNYKKVEYPNNSDTNDLASFAPRNHNSLWESGSRSFFRDQRARRVGDIVKINIKIEDKANLDNKTEQKRNTNENLGMPNIFGFEKAVRSVLPKPGDQPVDLNTATSIAGSNNHSGEGKIARKETIQTQIAAMITQILPNGNLVINGKQEIRVNYELREIGVEGIARPEDISLDNSISSDQIAELRISYGGRGRISEIQQPRYGTQVLEILSPF
ncbi:MAG: flagellar basal body L-ring protein FlgH [Sphingobacteriia bacterium]|nr:flagellar basal body L-ring protein FlgH [Sphingobacteriia bacterium]